MQLPYFTYWYKHDHDTVIQDYEHDPDIYDSDDYTVSSIYPAQDAALLYEENLTCQEEK